MIFYDHCYTGDDAHRFLKKLGRLGFTLEPQTVEHPNQHFCRFLKFDNPKVPRKLQYLEFVWGKLGDVKKPGFCFGHSGGLDRYHAKLKRDRKYPATIMHKNYEWKKDRVSRLPGWNFVNFPKLKMPGIFPWFTEYEPHPSRKPTKAPKHPNGARKIHGFVIEVDARGERFFSYLLGKRLQPRTQMACGTILYVTKGKRTTVRAAVVELKSLKSFLRRYKPDSQGVFFGRDAARIENPDRRMWDLILI